MPFKDDDYDVVSNEFDWKVSKSKQDSNNMNFEEIERPKLTLSLYKKKQSTSDSQIIESALPSYSTPLTFSDSEELSKNEKSSLSKKPLKSQRAISKPRENSSMYGVF